jgi:DNA-directed RNA polymerase specialized sigma24 family protein
MDRKSSAVRFVLSTTDPKRAIEMVKSFSLPSDEEVCIIDREIKKKSIQQIAMEQNISPETVKRRRRSGLYKIVDSLRI